MSGRRRSAKCWGCWLLRSAPVYGSKPFVAEEGIADTDCADSLVGVSFTRVSPVTGRFRVAERDPVQIVDAHRERDVHGIQGFTASALGGAQPADVVVAPGDIECGPVPQ